MPTPTLDAWKPLSLPEVRESFRGFERWFLCGGESVDLFVGKKTRSHGDVDIGVYRSELSDCLQSIDSGVVYICDPPGTVTRWFGEIVKDHVHDIWVASPDESCWIMQILVYTDQGDTVFFKRDNSVTWLKSQHTISCGGYQILNPAITLLYKASRGSFEKKDAQDIATIIGRYAVNGSLKLTPFGLRLAT